MLFDLAYTLRRLRHSPGVTTAIVVTLALCIGVNALVFSLLYAVILKPLLFPKSEQLVEIYNSYPKTGVPRSQGNVTQYLDYAKHPELFAGVAVYLATGRTLGDAAGPVRVSVGRVTPNFFATLGIRPVIGQFFDPSTTSVNNDHFVVLTDSFWRAHFNADPDVLGRKLTIDDQPYVVTGVAAPSAAFLDPGLTLFVPLSWDPQWFDGMSRHTRAPRLVGRLIARVQPGFTLSQAAARIASIDHQYYDSASGEYRRYVDKSDYRSVTVALRDEQGLNQKNTLYLLQCGTLFVLLIGCVNIANLLLARAHARQAEIAIRHALGGGRWEIARQLLLESLVLGCSGGIFGIGLSIAGMAFVQHYAAGLLPLGVRLALDTPILIFSLVLSVVVGVLVGLLPAIHVTRKDLLRGIQQNSRNVSAGRSARLVGSILAAGQVALSLILLAGTGLLVRSLVQAVAVPPGIDTVNVTTARVALPPHWFTDLAGITRLQAQILDALRQIPGVESAGLASSTPMTAVFLASPLFIYGDGGVSATTRPLIYNLSVSPGFFPTLGVKILRGRAFDSRDDAAGAQQTAIIDRRLADRFFSGQDPTGRRIALDQLPTSDTAWLTIVGVVETAHYTGLDDAKEYPFVYLPIEKAPYLGNSYFVRSRRSSADLIPIIRQRILAINPTLPVYNTGSLDEFVANSLSGRKSVLMLLGIFVGLALTLSAIGIYSVLAYDVALRTREIGIRGAIGASRGTILAMILVQGLRKTVVGIVIGLVGALYLGRMMAGLLFQVSPADPPTLVIVALVLFLFGLMASLLPARRAAQIDPNVALRSE